MNRKTIGIVCSGLGILLVFSMSASARPAWRKPPKAKVNTWWEKRADTNNDGMVDSGELKTWKNLERERLDLNNDGTIDAKERRLSWRHARCRVNTETERKYDENNDGWLETAEVRKMLRDRYTLVNTHGKAKVDSELEEAYDTNNDGIIDRNEAKVMHDDLQ